MSIRKADSANDSKNISFGDHSHPIKRLRENSATYYNRSIDSTEALQKVDLVKKVTLLEMQVTKLTEEKAKYKIENECREEEKKQSFLREDEEEKNRRDRVFSQRNALFEKNQELTEELDSMTETYRDFHKDMSDKNNKLLAEVGDLKNQLLEKSDELFAERRRAAHELKIRKDALLDDIATRDISIINLESELKKLREATESQEEELEAMQAKLVRHSELQKSEFSLRAELDSIKNKEAYATVFPEKIVQSQQIFEENSRLQRDIKNLRETKEHTGLLKIQLEDKEKEIASLNQQITKQQEYRRQMDHLSADMEDWKRVKEELGLSSPQSIISHVSKLQNDALLKTSLSEKYKSEANNLSASLMELKEEHSALKKQAEEDAEKCVVLRTKLARSEEKRSELAGETESCRKLLETYQATTEDERQNLPKTAGLKILHMRHNPCQNKIDEELSRLKAENKKLQDQLEMADNTNLVKELEMCQVKVQESEAALKKTKSIFKTHVKTFKESVFELFGYTITCPSDNQYSLLSAFAESSDNAILFFRGEGGDMQLLETKYTRTLDMKSHISKLTQHRSIPLFLSDVTSDLFHRQTCISDYLEYTTNINK